MESLEQIRDRLSAAFPDAEVTRVPNDAPSAQHSLLVRRERGREIGAWLRDDPELQLDYCSNVTGIDWPPRTEKVKVKKTVDGVEKEVEASRDIPGYLEVVYHLYSMSRKHGPLVLRMRTADREDGAWVPSMTPVWRSCELQEREVFDLFGVRFEGHPDLRRLLMWEGFLDHPMRKDYVEPDDYEYEPTPHDHVLERVTARRSGGAAA